MCVIHVPMKLHVGYRNALIVESFSRSRSKNALIAECLTSLLLIAVEECMSMGSEVAPGLGRGRIGQMPSARVRHRGQDAKALQGLCHCHGCLRPQEGPANVGGVVSSAFLLSMREPVLTSCSGDGGLTTIKRHSPYTYTMHIHTHHLRTGGRHAIDHAATHHRAQSCR